MFKTFNIENTLRGQQKRSNITDGIGSANKIRYERYIRTETEDNVNTQNSVRNMFR